MQAPFMWEIYSLLFDLFLKLLILLMMNIKSHSSLSVIEIGATLVLRVSVPSFFCIISYLQIISHAFFNLCLAILLC